VKVIVADDQTAVREGLVTILGHLTGVEVVGAAADGEEAVRLCVQLNPDVVLMDLRMPRMDGVEATAVIRESCPATQVVVLTTYADDDSILSALSAGAIGYLTKDAGREDILRALQAAQAGQAVLDPAVHGRLLAAARARPRPVQRAERLPDGLTEREAEVLVLIGKGLSNHEIAAQLHLGGSTVKTHVNRIFAKTNSRDRAQAVGYAHHHGLVG
jgi:DNA-binding NarL/FixJ family response regulator